MSKKNTTIAIVYDFDGTLAPGNMQEHSFIPSVKIENKKFWEQSMQIAEENDMDGILAYMELMLKKGGQAVKKKDFQAHGKGIKFFKGVETWFDRINTYANNKNINIEHYIISSGLREMIEGTTIYKNFNCVFASGYKYNEDGIADYPALAINYTTKTQYLFRINKGIHNSWDNSSINKFTPLKDRPILFENMIYLGDGDTDIPAMKMLNYQGGTSIGVYSPDTPEEQTKAQELLKNNRANYIAIADYSQNSEIDQIIKSIITQISAKANIKTYTEKI